SHHPAKAHACRKSVLFGAPTRMTKRSAQAPDGLTKSVRPKRLWLTLSLFVHFSLERGYAELQWAWGEALSTPPPIGAAAVAMRTDRPIPELQGMNNKALVQVGLEWFAKSNTVAAILEFYWNIDQSKIIGTTPEVIAVQTYDNRKSASPLQAEFSFT